jgi:hypothetical protein
MTDRIIRITTALMAAKSNDRCADECHRAMLASVTDEQLIQLMAATVRAGCGRMTADQLAALAASVARAESLPARPWWDRKAVAHAETIGMLGVVTGDPALIWLAGLAAGWTYDLATAAGVAADGVILASRRRLLHALHASDADAAAQEIEKHLRVLSFMARLSSGHGPSLVTTQVS